MYLLRYVALALPNKPMRCRRSLTFLTIIVSTRHRSHFVQLVALCPPVLPTNSGCMLQLCTVSLLLFPGALNSVRRGGVQLHRSASSVLCLLSQKVLPVFECQLLECTPTLRLQDHSPHCDSRCCNVMVFDRDNAAGVRVIRGEVIQVWHCRDTPGEMWPQTEREGRVK